MKIKRILSALLGLPLVVLVLVFGNKYVIDIFFALVAVISMYEYFNAIKEKANPVKWIGYLSAISIAFIHIIPGFDISYVGLFMPFIVVMLFIQSGIILQDTLRKILINTKTRLNSPSSKTSRVILL